MSDSPANPLPGSPAPQQPGVEKKKKNKDTSTPTGQDAETKKPSKGTLESKGTGRNTAGSRSSRSLGTRATDPLTISQTLLRTLATGLLAAIGAAAAWYILGHTFWAAYNTSTMLAALSTAATILTITITAIALWLWVFPPRNHTLPRWARTLIPTVAYLAPAGLIMAQLSIPLASTRLYLGGISVDQSFRTQFLTRMTDHLGWLDMNYSDMPSFYPGLWFFSGGIFARLAGMDAWAAFQPWSIITLSVASCILVPLWQRALGSLPLATVLALASTAITLRVSAEEPYAAIVGLGMPLAFIIARRAIEGGGAALVGSILYLGLSANLYTLFTAISALSISIIALITALSTKTIKPLIRLCIIGGSSLAIAALGWAPYIYALFTREHEPSKAQHFLPTEGTVFPLPFFDHLALFILGVAAVIWLIVRYRDPDAQSQSLGLLVCYGWTLASMLAPIVGTTLLGFRMALPITLLLVCAGIMALADCHTVILRWLPQVRGVLQQHTINVKTQHTTSPQRPLEVAPRITNLQRSSYAVLAVMLALTGIHYSTSPLKDQEKESINLAYEDTDGSGQRADLRPAGSARYYKQIDAALTEYLADSNTASSTNGAGTQTGKQTKNREDLVILTSEKSFLSYYPYHGFQAITAHYANPLGEFMRRNEAIESWSTLSSPQELLDAMNAASQAYGWKMPDVFLMREYDKDNRSPDYDNPSTANASNPSGAHDSNTTNTDEDGTTAQNQDAAEKTDQDTEPVPEDSLEYWIAEDIYPNNPNVRFRKITFPASLFSSGWELRHIGPFVLVLRTP